MPTAPSRVVLHFTFAVVAAVVAAAAITAAVVTAVLS